jgi:O-antigen/teichoic acid export membrane protein
LTAPEAEATGTPSLSGRSSALGMIGRFGWGLADQLLSSFTNFLLGLLVARAVTPSDLGAFSLAYATFTLTLGAVRALAGETLVVRHSAVSQDRWRQGVRGSSGTAVTAGVVVGAGCLIAGAIVGGSLGIVFGIVGICLPALLLQDVWRFAFFADGRGGAAFLNDLTWTLVMLSALALLRPSGASSVALFTLAWAGAGCVAALVGALQLKVFPAGPMTGIRWLRHHRDLGPRFLAEFGLATGTSNLLLFGMGSVMGLAQLGRLRAGQIALGPLNILFGGAGMVATPEGVRLLRESPKRLLHGCCWISLTLASAPLVLGAVLLSLPTSAGQFLLGANWEPTRSLLVPLSIGAAAYGAAFGAYAGMRSLAAAKRSLRARYLDASATCIFALAGAAVGGALGAAWGFTIAGLLKIGIAWWQFGRALIEYEADSLSVH